MWLKKENKMKKIIFAILGLSLGHSALAEGQKHQLSCSVVGSLSHELNFQTKEVLSEEFILQPGSVNTLVNDINLNNLFGTAVHIYVRASIYSEADRSVSIGLVDQKSGLGSSTYGDSGRLRFDFEQRKADLAEINQIDISCTVE
jgi:hypothetical protein